MAENSQVVNEVKAYLVLVFVLGVLMRTYSAMELLQLVEI